MNNWIAIGPPDDWRVVKRDRIWKAAAGYVTMMTRMEPGDVLFFFATAPVNGVIGYGAVSESYVEDPRGGLIATSIPWPLRARFESMFLLPVESWEAQKIPLAPGSIDFRKAWQELPPESAQALGDALSKLNLE